MPHATTTHATASPAPRTTAALLALFVLAPLAACDDPAVCAPPDPVQIDGTPRRLSETGLYADVASETLGSGVRAYRPNFELWSDGAVKRRWIRLPAGAVIDTSDMDSWRLPVGTRIWKEFTRDGVRVETRLLERVGEGDADWAMVAYLWNDAGTDAERITDARADARGTPHDVPSASQCLGCHGGRRSRVLGFSAVQLEHDGPEGEWTLASLAAAGVLSHPPAARPVVPGDETTRAALGYLHANCGHCHNAQRPARVGPRCFDPQNALDLWLRVGALSTPEQTPAWRTAVGTAIAPGAPDQSRLVRRASRRGGGQMPPLGTESVDEGGVATLRAWIASVGP